MLLFTVFASLNNIWSQDTAIFAKSDIYLDSLEVLTFSAINQGIQLIQLQSEHILLLKMLSFKNVQSLVKWE